MTHIIWVITWVMIYLSQWSSKRNYKTYRGQWRTSKWIPWNTKDFYGYWFFQLTYVLFLSYACCLYIHTVHAFCTWILNMYFVHTFVHLVCTFSLYMHLYTQFVYASCTSILNMNFEHAFCTCKLYMHFVHASCTCILYINLFI